MGALIVAIVLVSVIFAAVFLLMYGLYRYAFCLSLRKRPDVRRIPDSRLYRDYRQTMLEVVEEMDQTSYETVSISSQDGLLLCGRLYIIKEDAPMIIFFHGYHGTAAWDGYGFFRICRENSINILMADERAHGKSEGSVITLGIMERCDCKSWSKYVAERFGENTDIFLAGVSMGAASVIMSSELDLPRNVRALIADCGYSRPATMLMETVKSMKLPVKPIYLFLKHGARLFGHFDLEGCTALEAVEKLKIPILFIHGAQDSIVPSFMGEELYNACTGRKAWTLIEKADHANSAMTDYQAYEKSVLHFIGQGLEDFDMHIQPGREMVIPTGGR